MTSEFYSELFDSQLALHSSRFGSLTQPAADEEQCIVQQDKRCQEGKGTVGKMAGVKTPEEPQY